MIEKEPVYYYMFDIIRKAHQNLKGKKYFLLNKVGFVQNVTLQCMFWEHFILYLYRGICFIVSADYLLEQF